MSFLKKKFSSLTLKKLNFEESLRKSHAVFQYKCIRCNNSPWWGTKINNKCNSCGSIIEKLPLKKNVLIEFDFMEKIKVPIGPREV